MGRAPCCEKVGLKKGRWTAEEDEILRKYIHAHGEGSWRSLPKNSGLLRCGKSCRLRWVNYLRDDLRRGNISAEEEDIIIKLHASLGNRWSLISEHLPGRTDNDIKNYWNCHLSRKIHIFNRARNDILPVLMDFAKVGDGCKGKGGHTNRSAVMKNCKTTSIVKMTIKKPEGGGGTGVIRPIVEKETLIGGVDGKDGERQKMVLDPCQYQNCREGMVGISEENHSQGGESESVVFFSKEEREAGILRSCEGQDSRVVCPYDIMNNSANGMSSLTKELENWGNSPTGEGSGILSSNGESGDQWYSSSSMASCFDDKWAGWDWEGVHNLWEVGTEEILSRLWESDVNE